MTSPQLEQLKAVILLAFPELASSTFSLEMEGWDSTAVDVDDDLIFKFPRHAVAEASLVREAALLEVIRGGVTLPVPDLHIHAGPPLFSKHRKLRGQHLLAAQYEQMPPEARQHVADKLGQFYAQLHRLDQACLKAAGATRVGAWQTPDEMRAKALPALPVELRALASRLIREFEDLPPDPHGVTFGHFDGHGWNMAFDHAAQSLVGLYDFADSGFGPVHQEFIYSNLISADLTHRIASAYEAASGRLLNRRRIALLTGIHRLSELAELYDHPERGAEMVRNFIAWAKVLRQG